MPTRSPEVSIVIPTRDRWPFLAKALTTALRQEEVELEVIVVDDASSDETTAELANIVDPRVRVLRNDSRQGVARARNRGIDAARGEWVAFLDDDDAWAPRKLRLQLDAAKPVGASFSYSGGVIVERGHGVVRTLEPPDPDDLLAKILAWNVIGGPSTMLVRAEHLRQLHGFDENLSVQADWDLWIRLAQAGAGAVHRDVLVAYLKHPGNMQVVDVDRVVPEFELLEEKHRAIRQAVGVDPDYLTFWRWVALLLVRAGRRREAVLLSLREAMRYRSPGNVARALGALFGEPVMERVRSVFARDSRVVPEWVHRLNASAD